MKKSDLYEIAIKILGLYLVIIVINQLREVLMYATMLRQPMNALNSSGFQGQSTLFIVVLFNFILLLAFAGLLIFRTQKVTSFICKKQDFEEEVTLFAEKKTIYELALTIVGLITIVMTLPELAIQFKIYFQFFKSSVTSGTSGGDAIAISLLKMAIGVLAVLYAKTISSFLAKKD